MDVNEVIDYGLEIEEEREFRAWVAMYNRMKREIRQRGFTCYSCKRFEVVDKSDVRICKACRKYICTLCRREIDGILLCVEDRSKYDIGLLHI